MDCFTNLIQGIPYIFQLSTVGLFHCHRITPLTPSIPPFTKLPSHLSPPTSHTFRSFTKSPFTIPGTLCSPQAIQILAVSTISASLLALWDFRALAFKSCFQSSVIREAARMTNRLLGIATQVMLMAIIISITLFFIGIGVLVVLHVRIVGRAFQRWFLTISRGERCGASNGLSPDELEKIPCYDFDTAGEKETGGSVDCAVCLESFQMGDRCRLLPLCKHSFHAECVDSWLRTTPICPICRTIVDRRKGGGDFEDQRDRFASGVVMGFPVSASPSRF